VFNVRNVSSSSILLLAAGLGFVAAACDGAGVSDDPVTNTLAEGIDERTRLHLEHVRTFHSNDEVIFHLVGAGVIRSDSLAFVVNRGTSSVVRLSLEGDDIRSFGREGNGPGEFQNPIALATSAGGVVVWDQRLRRLTFIDEEMASARVLTVARAGAWNMVGTSPTSSIFLTRRDPANETTREFIEIDSAGALLREWTAPGHPRPRITYDWHHPTTGAPGAVTMSITDCLSQDIDVNLSGRRYLVDTGSGSVLRFNEEHSRPATVYRELNPPRLVEAARRQILNRTTNAPAEVTADALARATSENGHLPPWRAAVSSGDLLWLERARCADPTVRRQWDVITGDGSYLGMIELPGNAHLIAASRRYILVVAHDSLDVQSVELYRMTPSLMFDGET
jgi:hypothetical protein